MGNQIICHHCRKRRTVSPQETRLIRILLVGLDNAGKTTAAKCLVGEPVSAPAPTLGFSRLEVRRRGWTVELYDVGGGRGIRGIWRNYLAESHGLAFVVDAADTGRTDECRDTLHALLGDPRVAGKPVLILANKQDEPSALDEVELNERLQLEAAANQHRCPMRIELCAARPGAAAVAGKRKHLGIQTGFDWLADYVIDNNSSLEQRVTADLAVRAVELEQQRRARDERIRRNREAAAAAAAAAAAGDGGGNGGGEGEDREPDGDPVETVTVSQAAKSEPPARPATSPTAAPAAPASPPNSDLPAAAPEGTRGSPPPPPNKTPSPDTPLHPELEAQIQEVFTRTEMGRLVRDQTGRRDTSDSAGAPEEGRSASSGGGGQKEDRGGEEGGGTDPEAGGGGEGGGQAESEPVVVHPAGSMEPSSGRESPDSPVLEKDSGQGSIKGSDSETLLSSSASQLSTQANGVPGGKRRNRFFKRYTKTSPMPNDVLLASMSSMPPAGNE